MINHPINELVIPTSSLLMCIVMVLTSTLSKIRRWPRSHFYCACLRQVLHPLVVNAPSVALMVTVIGPWLMPLAIIALKLPLVSFRRAQ
jgi:hypothetical protein